MIMLVMFNVNNALFINLLDSLAEVVVLLSCVREVPGSNLRPDTD